MHTDKCISYAIRIFWLILILSSLIAAFNPQMLINRKQQKTEKTDELMALAARELSMGNMKEAEKKLETILKTDPTVTEAAVELARLEYLSGNKKNAFAILNQYAVYNPSKAFECYYLMADFYLDEKQAAKAIDYIKLAYRSEPFDWEIYNRLANIYSAAGDHKQLQAALQMFIRSKTSFENYLLSGLKRDMIYSKNLQQQQQIKILIDNFGKIDITRFDKSSFETVINRDKSIALAYLRLFYSYKTQADNQNAHQCLELALRYWPVMQEALVLKNSEAY